MESVMDSSGDVSDFSFPISDLGFQISEFGFQVPFSIDNVWVQMPSRPTRFHISVFMFHKLKLN